MSSTSTWDHELLASTSEALTAAEGGQWSVVDDYYRRRAKALAEGEVTGLLAKQLLTMDIIIQGYARTAHASLTQLLQDIASTRRALASPVQATEQETGACIDERV